MSFCPICKIEYREGFEYCSDCKVKLVDKLPVEINEEVPNIEETTENISNADTMAIEDMIDSNVMEILNLTPDRLTELKDNPPTEEELIQLKRFIYEQRKLEEDKEKFVSKKEKVSDYKSSGITLLILGSLGLIYVILAFLGVLPFVHLSGYSYVIYSIVGVVFAILIYFGISSLAKVKSTKAEALKEDAQINDVRDFFDKTMTSEFIDSDLQLTEDDNLNFFMRNEKMKAVLKSNYPELKEGFIEELIDEKYSEIFG